MVSERFTVWVQVEGSRDEREWNLGLPDRLAVFSSESAARHFLANLLRAVGSPDAEDSEQVLFGVRPPEVCVAEAIAREQPHFCPGCGRCMVGGCDGLFTLHAGDCPRVFCLRCGGQFAGVGEADICECVVPASESPYCGACANLLWACSC